MILCITAEWTSAIADIVTSAATVALLFVALNQLSKLNDSLKTASDSLISSKESNRLTNLIAILDHEAEITKRKSKLSGVAFEIQEYNLRNPQPDDMTQILFSKHNTAIEDYLNAIDRLAYCILNDYFQEKEWKREYRGLILSIVKDYEDWLGPSSAYVNLIDLHAQWIRE